MVEEAAFLTDATYKHTLAIARSLGQKSIQVDVGSNSPHPLCRFSKYVNTTYVYPPIDRFPTEFIEYLLKLCYKKKYAALIPVGHDATILLSKEKKRFRTLTKIPVADFEKLAIAARKDKTLELAVNLKIPTPRTLKLDEKGGETKEIDYPLVVKGATGSGLLHYANNPRELLEKASIIKKISGRQPIVQEYIKGEGYGFFALYNYGKPKAIFMHKRLREYPITGGPSTCAVSIYDTKLKDYGIKLLNALKWHGVAMVEFKKSIKDNEFKLMEINTKFWGSLDLAITAGVDFPYLLYKMTTEGDAPTIFNYKVGVRFMWPFPDDFLHTLSNPKNFKNYVKDLSDKRVKKNILFSDLKPSVIQLLQTTSLLLRKLKEPLKLRYPQGMVK
jgi:predicted ATP-grasp superfamily ATP-dependent carboligase